MFSRHKAEPSRKLPPTLEMTAVSDRRHKRCRDKRTNAWDCQEPAAVVAGSGDGLEFLRDRVNIFVDEAPLIAEAANDVSAYVQRAVDPDPPELQARPGPERHDRFAQ